MNNIDKYVQGVFSEVEFERISENMIAAKLDRDKRKDWEHKLKTQYKVERTVETVESKSVIWIKANRWLIASAATVLLVLSVFLLLPLATTPDYMSAVDQQIDNLSIMADQFVLRKGKQEVGVIRQEATLTYLKLKYEESIQLWEQVIHSEFTDGTDHFYLALCHLRKKRAEPQKSIDLLLESRTLNGPKEEIAWVLSLAYLKTGALDDARQELTSIVKENTYQAEAAGELLELID